jgi:hypothetical protein
MILKVHFSSSNEINSSKAKFFFYFNERGTLSHQKILRLTWHRKRSLAHCQLPRFQNSKEGERESPVVFFFSRGSYIYLIQGSRKKKKSFVDLYLSSCLEVAPGFLPYPQFQTHHER